MPELPPDSVRLRAILAHLERQLADTDTIRTYLRVQHDAVRQALAAAEGRALGRQQTPRGQRPAVPHAATPRPEPRPGGYVVENSDRTIRWAPPSTSRTAP